MLPLLAFSIYLCFTHTLSPEDGSLHCGQSTFGDMCLHLGFITSLSEQQFFPPLYSLLPDTAVGYPFLCDSISATLYSLGLPLRLSYMLPMFFALASVFCGAFFLLRVWLKDGRKTVVGYLLFFLGGRFRLCLFPEQSAQQILGTSRASLRLFTRPPPTMSRKTSAGSTLSPTCSSPNGPRSLAGPSSSLASICSTAWPLKARAERRRANPA